MLGQWFPERFIAVWLSEAEAQQRLQEYSKAGLAAIARRFTEGKLPNNTEGYRTAEVTLGGVDVRALSSKTGEVKQTPGLYFIGRWWISLAC